MAGGVYRPCYQALHFEALIDFDVLAARYTNFMMTFFFCFKFQSQTRILFSESREIKFKMIFPIQRGFTSWGYRIDFVCIV
jgi:hypothetical protein